MDGDGIQDDFNGGDVNIAAGRREKANFVNGGVSERHDQRMQWASEDGDNKKDTTIYDTTATTTITTTTATTTTTSTAAVEDPDFDLEENFGANLKANGECGADKFARDRAALARNRRKVKPHVHALL
jgi:hypothetical protein